jgi:hypothetical protein
VLLPDPSECNAKIDATFADGQQVRELGWDSLSLWVAGQFFACADHGGVEFELAARACRGQSGEAQRTALNWLSISMRIARRSSGFRYDSRFRLPC